MSERVEIGAPSEIDVIVIRQFGRVQGVARDSDCAESQGV